MNKIKNKIIVGFILLVTTGIVSAFENGVFANNNNVFNIVNNEIKRLGINANLNHIDVSNVSDMGQLFYHDFNGDISHWDVSNVKNMRELFNSSSFNGDISHWDVRNVEITENMFFDSKFNQDISHWDLGSLNSSDGMFLNSSMIEENRPNI